MEKPDDFVNLHYLSIFMFLALPITALISYIIAVSLGHVEPGFPYISDVGAIAPESCIFSQLMNMMTILMAVVVYVRYAQVKETIAISQMPNYWNVFNKFTLGVGLTATVGVSLLANFQVTLVFSVHLVGAVFAFVGSGFYLWLETIISYKMQPFGPSIPIIILRLAVSIGFTVCIFGVFIIPIFALKAFHGKNTLLWRSEDGGWGLHVTSAVCEWFCLISFSIYILTFTNEFRGIQLSCPKVILKTDYIRKTYPIFTSFSASTSPSHST
ncbi:DNA damage-regulated autophagy modulator protein 1 [Fopius arisanus]|uniref:DNA damage-regulated autophagy modulator protein 1 n=1 Tax=Fopius arisanus TaxID=64838 RepID=A0A9R1TG92_9HYME|nr:PREDICTED: DNA damage-regulated autophagy modulator protein 1 [Fopius arisanus]